MPKTIKTMVYSFDELDDDAKENARQWWREGIGDDFHADTILEDAERVAKILGIEFNQKTVNLYGGGTRQESKIYWSGFASQGDGACFEGSYSFAKGSQKAIREYAPQDTVLHDIADSLAKVQRPFFYALSASCSHRGHYYHSGCMSVSVDVDTNITWQDITDNAESTIIDAMREFADWIYDQLRKEYEYQMSDECIDETIIANEYTFTKKGKRFDG